MTNLRDYAEGKPCLVRVPNVCSGGTQSTVLAHVRLIGISGIGFKSPDILGAWACDACHAFCDSRHDDTTKAIFADGVYRTINQLIKEGVIKW